MQKLIFTTGIIALLLSISGTASAQCFSLKNGYAMSRNEGPIVSPGVIIDGSFKQYEPTGFYGFGIHAGIWAEHIGVFAGFVEYKLNDSTHADRVAAITLATRYSFLNDRLVSSAYFAAGTQNFADYGIRVGYDIWNNGIAIGAVVSRSMHYGISITIKMKK